MDWTPRTKQQTVDYGRLAIYLIYRLSEGEDVKQEAKRLIKMYKQSGKANG